MDGQIERSIEAGLQLVSRALIEAGAEARVDSQNVFPADGLLAGAGDYGRVRRYRRTHAQHKRLTPVEQRERT
jgi:hypothetical protein